MAKAERRKATLKRPKEAQAVIPEAIAQIDDLVEQAVQHINEIAASTVEKGCQGILEIGRYVLDKFFDNDPGKARFRSPQKETSFRELETHPGLQLSKSSLHNAVALAIQEHYLLEVGKGKVPESVSATHRVALLAIKPSDEQDKKAVAETARLKLKLMQEVSEKGLSVRQLQERIAGMGNKLIAAESADGHGKDEKPALHLPKIIENILSVPIDKIIKKDRLEKMSADDRRRYRNAINKAVDRLIEMMEQIDSLSI